MPFLADAALALGALFSFVLVGLATLRWVRLPAAGLESLAFGTGLGVMVHALLGLAVALSPWKQPTACLLFLLLWTISARTLWPARARWLARDPAVRQTLAVLTLFILVCVAATRLPVRFPPTLPDGLYIFKTHTLSVKMQKLAGDLPVDNYIPFAVGEYLLREVSFTREHPVIPGQEVSNRPVLMALATVPFRAALSPPPPRLTPLPRFQYVGSDWPDVGSFSDGPGFRQFLVVGIVLNALFLLGAALLFAAHGPRAFLLPGLLLLATSPFYLSQTIFTWPKLLAAFYLLLALHFLARRQTPIRVALAASLAYWSHPFALVFVFGFGCHYAAIAWRQRRGPAPLAPLILYGATAILLLAPWFAWAYLWLRLPTNMITQNMAGQPIHTLPAHVWVRITNLYQSLAPNTLGLGPFDAPALFRATISHLPGLLGLLTLPAYAGLLFHPPRHRLFVTQGILLPALLLSIPFSRPARLTWLAFHSIGVCFLFLALVVLAHLPRRLALSLIAAQLLLQLTLLFLHVRALAG